MAAGGAGEGGAAADADAVDYICFTNSYRVVAPDSEWELRYVALPESAATGSGGSAAASPGGGGRRAARYYKIMSHEVLPEYDVTLWMDPTHAPLVDPRRLMRAVDGAAGDGGRLPEGGFSVAAHAHNDRISAYDEADACSFSRKDDPQRILRQVN